MAAHATTVPEYCTTLGRSKLIPEPEVELWRSRWQQEAAGSDHDLDGFRKFLVSRRLLTDYQAAMIQRGHADGFMIAGYVIQDRIGKGQSAGVYKAVHATGQVVALKVLPASRAKEPKVLNRFQREGRLLTILDHPNVVRAFQVGQTGPVHFIVMEFIDGETLEDVLQRRHQLPPEEAVRLVQQALFGLQHIHEKRMIHRDLKPANLMITPASSEADDHTLDATLKILDVGIGREFVVEDSPETQDLMLTAEGTILGTPDYLAPEQARDARSADIRADIYSMGCVLYHLITGKTPYADKNVMGQMVKHATERIPPLSSSCKSVPFGLQSVLDQMTAKNPGDRYATPIEAAEALTPYLPEGATNANDSLILPAFKEFLKTEAHQSLPPLPEPQSPPISPPKPKPPKVEPPKVEPPKAPVSTGAKPARPPADEIDVELVDWPTPVRLPTSPEPHPEPPPRSWSDLNRRDVAMISVGAIGVLLAIGIGYGLAKLLKPKPIGTPTPTIVEPMPDEPEI